jgi:hypothetical protein
MIDQNSSLWEGWHEKIVVVFFAVKNQNRPQSLVDGAKVRS